MTREEIIQGLHFTIEMFLFNPNTGETLTEPRNSMDKITIEACRGAIQALEQKPILDKIRAKIEQEEKWLMSTGYNAYNVDIAFNSIKSVLAESEE